MPHTLILAVCALATGVSVCAHAGVDPASDPDVQPLASDLGGAYRLLWSDEFEAAQLDSRKWGYRTDSKLMSTQLPENISVSDGTIRIALKQQNAGGKAYTGGGIISKAYFRYGYYEARIKVPPGEGWHTSFWMMDSQHQATDTSQIELDPFENDSVDLTRYSADFHQWRSHLGHFKRFSFIYPDALLDEFHVYGAEFTPEEARYFFDGELVETKTSLFQRFMTKEEAAGRHPLVRDISDFEHNDMNIWFTSIAAKLGGTTRVDESMLPAEAVADYVRFFAAETPELATMFVEVTDVIPFEPRARRKFDNAVIADLDRDGLQDLIIVEHGHTVRVFWNQGGAFSEPREIATGDLHGIAVADIDRDQGMDVLIAQGGGDGANPRRPLHFQVTPDRAFEGGATLDYFEPGRGRAVKFLDADGSGSPDLFVTGFPLATQERGANHLYENAGGGSFDFVTHLPQAKWMGYRAQVTDFNMDHDPDVLFYGGVDMVAVVGGEGNAFSESTEHVLGELADTSHVSSVTEIDFDNDGDFDLFLTRSEPQFDLETYHDEQGRRFAFLIFRDAFQFDIEVEGRLRVENLQVTYPHYDVLVGGDRRKLEFGTDRHGGKSFELVPEDAEGWPEGLTEGGLYIGYLGDDKWRIGGQAHSRTAAVFGNVLSAPAVEPQVELPARLLENRGGHFVDVTAEVGISIKEQTTSAAAGDFDNNGWPDLIVLRYGDMAMSAEHIVYLNQGEGRFLRAEKHGIRSKRVGTTGGSVEPFDYDLDGALDLIYSNERGRWHLLGNNVREAGKYAIVNIGDSPSGEATALGALLTVKACGNTYRRRVGSTSAAFSQGMDTNLHLGLGACGTIDEATVRWTNGEVSEIQIRFVNTRVSAGRASARINRFDADVIKEEIPRPRL